MQNKDDHPLGYDNHKEDPFDHSNVCEVVPEDEQPKKPAESQDRGQDEDSPQCLPDNMGVHKSIKQSNRVHHIMSPLGKAYGVGGKF